MEISSQYPLLRHWNGYHCHPSQPRAACIQIPSTLTSVLPSFSQSRSNRSCCHSDCAYGACPSCDAYPSSCPSCPSSSSWACGHSLVSISFFVQSREQSLPSLPQPNPTQPNSKPTQRGKHKEISANLLILQQIRSNRATNRTHNTTQRARATSMCQHGAHTTASQRSAETTVTVRSYWTSRAASLAGVLLMLMLWWVSLLMLMLTVALLAALIVVLSLAVVSLSSAVLGLAVRRGSISVGLVVVVLWLPVVVAWGLVVTSLRRRRGGVGVVRRVGGVLLAAVGRVAGLERREESISLWTLRCSYRTFKSAVRE